MRTLGYDRCEVDAVGNAVGEMGAADAGRMVVLLGHIDTVYGNIPVRVEENETGPVLYGRAALMPKARWATFTSAVARLGSDWAHANDIRFVVVGAVEEEAATSRGARFIRDRFGRPERADARFLYHRRAERRHPHHPRLQRAAPAGDGGRPTMAHSAGPNPGVGTTAVDLWEQS